MDAAEAPPAALADLRDIVLPAAAPGGPVADLAAAVTVGLLAALLLALVLRSIAPARRPAAGPPTTETSLAAARTLPAAERMRVMAGIAAEIDRDLPGQLLPDLYRPSPVPDLDAVERQLLGRLG